MSNYVVIKTEKCGSVFGAS